MRRCPDCGFRTEDKTCPLCGVRTRVMEVPTHVHQPGESCMLPNQSTMGAVRPPESGAYMPRQTPVCTQPRKKTADGTKSKKLVLTIVKVIGAIILLQIVGNILAFIFW